MRSTTPPSALAASAELSIEPLSATTSSIRSGGYLLALMLARQRCKRDASFRTGMMKETRGIMGAKALAGWIVWRRGPT